MKKMHLSISTLVASIALAAAAQADTIAHWNFNTPTGGGTNPEYTSPLSSDSGSGTLAYTFTTGYIDSFGGSTVNAVGSEAAGSAVAFQGGVDLGGGVFENNGATVTVAAPTTGYESVIVSLAAQRTSSGFNSVAVEYSDNAGGSWTAAPGSPLVSGTTAGTLASSFSTSGVLSFDLSAITAVDDNANFQVRFTFTGATSATGNVRMDNLRIDGTSTSGTITPTFSAYSSSADKVIVDFSVAPTVSVVAGDFSIGGTETPTVSSVANVSGDTYELTLSGAASGDLTLDTITYDNSTDNAATSDLFAGIVSLSTIRTAVLGDANYEPSITGGYMTVQGVVIENTTDAVSQDNVTIQQGTAGILIRDASATNLPGAVAVGDEVLFVGSYTVYNGLQEVEAGPGLIQTVSTSNPAPSPVVLTSTSTPAEVEAAESTLVTISNVTFTNGGTSLPATGSFGSGVNQAFNETTLIASRFVDDLDAVFGSYALPTTAQDVSGVLTQFDNTAPRDGGYQVLPLLTSDIVVHAAVSDWFILD